jgi:hypothetical protein
MAGPLPGVSALYIVYFSSYYESRAAWTERIQHRATEDTEECRKGNRGRKVERARWRGSSTCSHCVPLFAAWYNFRHRQETISTTPAVAGGLADEPWSLERLLTESAGMAA